MKVFGCKYSQPYGGGIILVAAESKEQAFDVASSLDCMKWAFQWLDENDEYTDRYSPDVVKVVSLFYPIENWYEVKRMEYDCDIPQIIIEESYGE